MSQKRQDAVFDSVGDRRSQITTLTHDYPAGQVIPSHFHDRDQLVYASRGVMTVRTNRGAWVVPTYVQFGSLRRFLTPSPCQARSPCELCTSSPGWQEPCRETVA